MWPQLQGGPGGWESPAGEVSAWRASCPCRRGESFLLLQPLAPSRQRCSQEQVGDSMAVRLTSLHTAGIPCNPNPFPFWLLLNSSPDLLVELGRQMLALPLTATSFTRGFLGSVAGGWGWSLDSGVQNTRSIFGGEPLYSYGQKGRSHPAVLPPFPPCFISPNAYIVFTIAPEFRNSYSYQLILLPFPPPVLPPLTSRA